MDKQKLLEQLFSLSLGKTVGIVGVSDPRKLKSILDALGYGDIDTLRVPHTDEFVVFSDGTYQTYNFLRYKQLTYTDVIEYYRNRGTVESEPLDVVGLFSKLFKIVDVPRDKHDDLHKLLVACGYRCELEGDPDHEYAKQWYVSHYGGTYHAMLYPSVAAEITEQVQASDLLAYTFVQVSKDSLCQTVSLLDSLGFKILGNVRGLLYVQPNRPNVHGVLDLNDLIRLYTEV